MQSRENADSHSDMALVVLTEKRGNAFWITFNRPARKNALNVEMYELMMKGLDTANRDDEIAITVVTGIGEYYSSGNDFAPDELAKSRSGNSDPPFYLLVQALIRHTKPLIALVNGPAIGIACTTLGLFDLVVASDKAYFLCPFSVFGLCAEGCSSYTFPRIMGYPKAAQMIQFAEPLNAADAFTCGFVAKLMPHSNFPQEAKKLVEKYQTLSPESLKASRRLMRDEKEKNKLLEVNRMEKEELELRFGDSDTLERIMKKFSKPSKL